MTTPLRVTHENFAEIQETALLGHIKFQNYNSDCVSSKDVALSRTGNQLLDELVSVVLHSGNSPFMLIDPAYEWAGYELSDQHRPEDYAHITDVKPFSIDIPDLGDFYVMCQHVKSTVTDRAQFLADMKYR